MRTASNNGIKLSLPIWLSGTDVVPDFERRAFITYPLGLNHYFHDNGKWDQSFNDACLKGAEIVKRVVEWKIWARLAQFGF